MRKYTLSLAENTLSIRALSPEAALFRFIEHFGLSYIPEKIKIKGQKNPFLDYPFSERPACEILGMMADAAECEVVC